MDVTDCVVVHGRDGLVCEVEYHQSSTNSQDHFRRCELFFVFAFVVVISFLIVAEVVTQKPHKLLTELISNQRYNQLHVLFVVVAVVVMFTAVWYSSRRKHRDCC